MKTLRRLTLILAITGSPLAVRAQTATAPTQTATAPVTAAADPAIIKARAERTAKAFLAGDFAGVVDLTYPPLVKVFGGREKMVNFLEKGIGEMKGQGFAFADYRVGEPAPVVTAAAESGGRRFVIVPTTLMMNSPGARITQPSYLLGVAEPGAEWTFLDGGGIRPETLKRLPLELPAGLTLPAKQAPTVEKIP